jgi:hypothetical protein
MTLESVSIALWRIVWSILGGGLFYLVWLTAFLLLSDLSGAVETALWVMAPVVTATGLAAGTALAERRADGRRVPFFRIWIWPLVGCVAGAAVVYPFGPMLIVFGMLALGTAAVALRQGVGLLRAWRNRDGH